MKLVNSLGRVLLHVTSADCDMDASMRPMNVLYSYTGPHIGGYTDLIGLHAKILCLTADHPSAKVEGLLPEATVRKPKPLKLSSRMKIIQIGEPSLLHTHGFPPR